MCGSFLMIWMTGRLTTVAIKSDFSPPADRDSSLFQFRLICANKPSPHTIELLHMSDCIISLNYYEVFVVQFCMLHDN